jgi:hypothetical protein
MRRPDNQQADSEGATPRWAWPADDQATVDITRYSITSYRGKGLSAWVGAARLVGGTWEDWQKRRSAPIEYLLKVTGDAVSERLYYRLARALDLPQQHVFWATNPARADLIAVAIRFEGEAFFPRRINAQANTVTYRRQVIPIANAPDFWRHGVLHTYCGTGDIHQAMVRGKTLFGIDAADCSFLAPLRSGTWRHYLAHYRSNQPAGIPVILEMMRRIASHPDLPDLIERELAAAPGPVFTLPLREVARYSSNVRLMHQDLVETLAGEDAP